MVPMCGGHTKLLPHFGYFLKVQSTAQTEGVSSKGPSQGSFINKVKTRILKEKGIKK